MSSGSATKILLGAQEAASGLARERREGSYGNRINAARRADRGRAGAANHQTGTQTGTGRLEQELEELRRELGELRQTVARLGALGGGPDTLLDRGGVAHLLGISASTLDRIRRRDDFPAPIWLQVGPRPTPRWRRLDLLDWLSMQQEGRA